MTKALKKIIIQIGKVYILSMDLLTPLLSQTRIGIGITYSRVGYFFFKRMKLEARRCDQIIRRFATRISNRNY